MRQCPWSLAGRQRRILCSPLPRQNSSWAPYLVSARDGHDGSPSWLCFVESQPLVCGILSRRPNLPEREQRRRLLLNRSLDVVEGERYLSNAQRGTGACSPSPALRPRLAPAATYQVRGTAGSLRGRVCLAEMACQVSFRARGVGATDSPRRVAEIVGWRGISAHRQTATPSPPASARSLRARVCLAEMGRGDRMVCQRIACGATDKRMVGAVWSLFGKNGVPAKCGFGVRLT